MTIAFRWCLFGALISLFCVQHSCIEQAASIPAQTIEKTATPNPVLVQLANDYRTYFLEAMQAAQTPGAALAIVKGDTVVLLEGFGLKKNGTRDSVDIHTVFRIGSLSKGFAGILTGKLVQEGVLEWNQRVQDCFPEFTLRNPEQAGRIQLWHLLSHTTGLPYHAFTNLIEKGYDTRRIVLEYFAKAPLGGEEGVFFSYQNAAFCVIEEVMKASTQKDYPTLLGEEILQPAGMSGASCDFSSISACNNKSLPHFWTGAYFAADSISSLYYNAAAAGGVNASIADMAEWLKLLLGHKPQIIADTTLDRVFRPIIDTGKERRILPNWLNRDEAYYALGWRVLQHEGDTIIYHGGYVNGFRGEIAFNRRDDIGICVLMNASTPLSGACIPAFFERWKQVRK